MNYRIFTLASLVATVSLITSVHAQTLGRSGQQPSPASAETAPQAGGEALLKEIRGYDISGIRLGMNVDDARKTLIKLHPPKSETHEGTTYKTALVFEPFKVVRDLDAKEVTVGFVARYSFINFRGDATNSNWSITVLTHNNRVWGIHAHDLARGDEINSGEVFIEDFKAAIAEKYPAVASQIRNLDPRRDVLVQASVQADNAPTAACDALGFSELNGSMRLSLGAACRGGFRAYGLNFKKGKFAVVSANTLILTDGEVGNAFFKWLKASEDADFRGKATKPKF